MALRHDATPDVREAVVIGGGIAGLTAAWRLRHRDVVVLEASDRVGGRMHSEPYGDYWLNYGAHLLPAPGSLIDGLVDEFGLEAVPVWGSMMGLAVGDTKLTSGPVETYPFRLPITWRDRVAFARAGLRVQNAVRARRRHLRSGANERGPELRARLHEFDDGRTFRDLLGRLPGPVEEIFACASHRATAELDELSAGSGIGLFALVWGGRQSLIARNLLGGSARLPQAMEERLGARVHTSSPATAIVDHGGTLAVSYQGSGGTAEIRARHVIVATPAPYAASLVRDVAPAAADALDGIRYGAFLCVAIATSETGPRPWDDVYAMATPGRVFDMFTNQAHASRRDGDRRPGGSLMLFAGGHGADRLAARPDDEIVDRFVADLDDLFPGTRRLVAEARVQRWPLGNAFATPGRSRLQPALEGPLGPAGNLHLAGDYFAELGNLEMAARTGAAAAERVDAMLGDARSASVTTNELEAIR